MYKRQKSNITESLRWALGESSAKSLRGGKMPDVIFAGTEVRKALNYAEVAVTLDNSDGFIAGAGETIRVERHIYRNGDNDYLIEDVYKRQDLGCPKTKSGCHPDNSSDHCNRIYNLTKATVCFFTKQGL